MSIDPTPVEPRPRTLDGPSADRGLLIGLGFATVGLLALTEQFAVLPGALAAYVSAYCIASAAGPE